MPPCKTDARTARPVWASAGEVIEQAACAAGRMV